MWYFGSLLLLGIIWAICVPLGTWLAGFLPWSLRGHARLFFAPAIGYAAIEVLANIHGWLWPYSFGSCALISGLLGAWAWWRGENRSQLVTTTAVVWLISIVASFPILAGVLRFEAFAPFNDNFTYLEHAQWLQSHSFGTPVDVSGYHPGESQIQIYQRLHERMGASFLLGWWQACFALDWSFRVFPSVVGSFLTVAACGIAGAIYPFLRRHRALSILLGTLAVLLPGGLRFGSIFGFFPQTAGLAFGLVSLFLLGAWLRLAALHPAKIHPLGLMAVTLPFVAASQVYFALIPFLVLAVLGYLPLMLWQHRRHVQLGAFSLRILALAAVALALLHVETYRAVQGILFNVSAAVGTPVAWSTVDYLGHAFGIRTGSWEPAIWLLKFPFLVLPFVVAATLLGGGKIVRARTHRTGAALGPILVFAAICVTAFLKFHFFTPRPAGWTVGQGSSWSAFKVSEWSFPALAVLALIGAGSVLTGKRMFTALRWSVPLLALLVALQFNFDGADNATRSFRQATGSDRSPFNTLLSVRAFVRQHWSDQMIYLDLSGAEQKLRQMLIHVLPDTRLGGDWTTDGYLFGSIRESERTISPDSDNVPRIFTDDTKPALASPVFGRLRIGNIGNSVDLTGTEADYGRESDATGWWHWVRKEISFYFRIRASGATQVHPKATFWLIDASAPISMEVVLPSRTLHFELDPARVQEADFLPAFSVPDGTNGFQVRFVSRAAPRTLSEHDARTVTFLIKNLEFITVTE